MIINGSITWEEKDKNTTSKNLDIAGLSIIIISIILFIFDKLLFYILPKAIPKVKVNV